MAVVHVVDHRVGLERRAVVFRLGGLLAVHRGNPPPGGLCPKTAEEANDANNTNSITFINREALGFMSAPILIRTLIN